jgi:hypothetical protein
MASGLSVSITIILCPESIVNISDYKRLYDHWQWAATLEQSYRRDRQRMEFELLLHLPYRRYKKLMHIEGGPWF